MVQGQDLEVAEAGKSRRVNEFEAVVVQVELLEGDEVHKFAAAEVGDCVVLQVEDEQLGEAVQGLVADLDDAAGVEVQGREMFPADERLRGEICQVVAVQVDGGGVHGDELRHVLVQPLAALDDVGGPGLIVVAVAALGTLHAAVAGEELAAHAESEAVLLVLADELGRLHHGQGQQELVQAGIGGQTLQGRRVRSGRGVAVIQATSDVLPVRDKGEFAGREE